MSVEIEHGGALDRAIARFGGSAQDWLDLSTGINPEHFPLPEFSPEIWNRLPDEGLLQTTLALARRYYRIGENAPIVAAPGTQALIQLMPMLAAPSTVAILGPTYQEHAAALRQLVGTWFPVPQSTIFPPVRRLPSSSIQITRMAALSPAMRCWRLRIGLASEADFLSWTKLLPMRMKR